MKVTATDFRNHWNTYLVQSEEEDIFIGRHGEIVAILTNPARMHKRKLDEENMQKKVRGRVDEYLRLTGEYVAAIIKALKP